MDMERLLRSSVKEILRHEDFDAFQAWMRAHLAEFLPAELPISELSAEMAGQMAAGLARMTWNAMPLPGNDFRPAPRPLPGRNESCHCGSGRKFKHCCAKTPQIEAIEPEGMWHILVDHLPSKDLARALERKKVPRSVLLAVAERYVKQGEENKAVTLLEPFFTGKIGRIDQDMAEYAFDVLVDAYDELGLVEKKASLIAHLLDSAPRGPLRSTAWQRKACILADQGRQDRAWEAFKNAMQDDPDSLGLCIVELHLLMKEGNWTQASDRARFWQAKISRQAEDAAQIKPLMDFLQSVIDDPQSAMDVAVVETADQHLDPFVQSALTRLGAWTETARHRPLPRYTVRAQPPCDPDMDKELQKALEKKLKGMGIPRSERDRVVTGMVADMRQQISSGTEPGSDSDVDSSQNEAVLVPAPGLKKVEKKWQRFFPLEKPFSTNSLPDLEDEDPWDPEVFPLWMQVLEDHPESFDSLSILDDLIIAATILIEETPHPRLYPIMAALLDRGVAVMQSLQLDDEMILPWIITENRPGLRCLSLATMRSMSLEKSEETKELSTYYLRLNPTDNHGLRTGLMNCCLHEGANEEALKLSDAYPEDIALEIVFGRILALYNLGRLKEAEADLRLAAKRFPHAVKYLTAKKIKQPKLHEMGYSVGGKDQAWLYRASSRQLWEAAPGALQWLAEAAGGKRLGKFF